MIILEAMQLPAGEYTIYAEEPDNLLLDFETRGSMN